MGQGILSAIPWGGPDPGPRSVLWAWSTFLRQILFHADTQPWHCDRLYLQFTFDSVNRMFWKTYWSGRLKNTKNTK